MTTAGQGEDQGRPFAEELARLEAFDPEVVRGTTRLGDLAFEEAPAQLATAIRYLCELQEENWADYDPSITQQIAQHATEAANLLDQMVALSSSVPDAQNQKNNLEATLANAVATIRNNWQAYAKTALMLRLLHDERAEESGAPEAREQARQELRELQDELRAVRSSLEEARPAVQAAREAAGVTAAVDLSEFYETRAKEERTAWKAWGWWLIAAIAGAIVGGILTVLGLHPDKHATNAEIVSSLAIDVLVVGLLLYAVRVVAMQFRAHRHLWAVARSKAAALRTFSRWVVTAAEPEVRGQVTLVVAQQILSVEDSGFADASGDHVTLIERVLSPAVQRLTQPPS